MLNLPTGQATHAPTEVAPETFPYVPPGHVLQPTLGRECRVRRRGGAGAGGVRSRLQERQDRQLNPNPNSLRDDARPLAVLSDLALYAGNCRARSLAVGSSSVAKGSLGTCDAGRFS